MRAIVGSHAVMGGSIRSHRRLAESGNELREGEREQGDVASRVNSPIPGLGTRLSFVIPEEHVPTMGIGQTEADCVAERIIHDSQQGPRNARAVERSNARE